MMRKMKYRITACSGLGSKRFMRVRLTISACTDGHMMSLIVWNLLDRRLAEFRPNRKSLPRYLFTSVSSSFSLKLQSSGQEWGKWSTYDRWTTTYSSRSDSNCSTSLFFSSTRSTIFSMIFFSFSMISSVFSASGMLIVSRSFCWQSLSCSSKAKALAL